MQHALNGDQGNLDTLRPRRGEAAILILCTDQVKNNSLDSVSLPGPAFWPLTRGHLSLTGVGPPRTDFIC